MFWCLMESWESMQAGRRLRWSFHVVHAGAIGFLIYSSASAWPLTAFIALTHIVCSVVKWKRGKVGLGEAVFLAGTYVVIGAPLLFFSWGVPALLSVTGENDATKYWRKIFEVGRSKPIVVVASLEFVKMAWGYTPVRAIVSGFVFVTGVLAFGLRVRRDKRCAIPLVGLVAGVALAAIAMRSSTMSFGLRRVAAVWPFGFIILASGLAAPWLIEMFKRWRTVVRVIWGAMVVVLLGLWISADIMAMKANGFPIPYRQIGQWLDSHFPKGTPVVTDRFYTAMCEFNQSDPTTNVVMLSTVPNELPEIQEKTRFRDVTRQYFEDNPDAVFYFTGHMYERPEVVPWDWPAKYFKRSRELKDPCAEELGNIGQNYHVDYPGVYSMMQRKSVDYSGTARWPIIYYNTIEDVVAIKKAEGVAGFVLWGPDWRPVQTQDYRLWRLLLSGDAGLKVYGLGDKEQGLTLELTGVAVGGELRVQVGDQTVVFPANQIAQQRIKVKLQPGMNVLRIRSRGAANARLLIGKGGIGMGKSAEQVAPRAE